MQDPIWLTKKTMDVIHAEQIDRHGGAQGTRDEGLLESAIMRPQQAYFYGQSDIIGLAALYSHGICKNHPYIDGNKRTGFLAAYTFLGMNGYQLIASEAEATVAMLDLAAGDLDETGFAAWLRDNVDEKIKK